MTDQQQNNTKSSGNIKVAAFTGGVNTPSSRFRIRQHISRLGECGIIVEEHIPFFEKSCGLPSPFKAVARIPGLFRARTADLVWLNKELVKGYKTFESLLKRPRVLDVDDAIWQSFPYGRLAAPAIARSMDAVIAGNTYVADYFSKYNHNIHIVPTAIDLNRYQQRPEISKSSREKFIIGWTGLACNYKYLKTIEPAIKRFLDDHKDAQLKLISNRPWHSKMIVSERITFIRWTKENEATALHDMSVGLMPLTDDKWTRGKCSFKMLQYMAAGIPSVVSPVGMNRDILQKANVGFAASSQDDWYNAMETLYNDFVLQEEMGKQGRSIVEQFYSAEIIAAHLAEIFKNIVCK